jgi:hypothetical protein
MILPSGLERSTVYDRFPHAFFIANSSEDNRFDYYIFLEISLAEEETVFLALRIIEFYIIASRN